MRLLKAILLSAALAPLALPAPELQTINVDQTLTVDRIGDGVMTIKLTLNGAQFQNWQSKYNENQSLLKRDMHKYVSQYEISAWDMQTNHMDRVVTITCKVKGAILYRGDGLFEFRVPKAWRGGERHESAFSFNYVEPAGPNTVSQTNVRLVLPGAAYNFADDKAETGDRIILYHLSVGGNGAWMLWGGIAILLLGLSALGYAFFVLRRPMPQAVGGNASVAASA
jgi:hypothetical protein